jgi:YD repeat-containing protein
MRKLPHAIFFLLAVAASGGTAGAQSTEQCGTPATGDAVRYCYDTLGRVTKAAYPNGRAIIYRYDTNGNRSSMVVTDQNGVEPPSWGEGSAAFVIVPIGGVFRTMAISGG